MTVLPSDLDDHLWCDRSGIPAVLMVVVGAEVKQIINETMAGQSGQQQIGQQK